MWLLLAQAAPGSEVTTWIQYGVLGLVVVGLLTGWLWPKPAVDRLLSENRECREEQSKQIEALIAEVHALRNDLERRRER